MTKEELVRIVLEHDPKSLWDLGDIEELDYIILSHEICVDKHRWYETAINVYKCDNDLIGIKLPSNIYSDDGDFESLCAKPLFYEMEEEKIVTYKIKQNKL